MSKHKTLKQKVAADSRHGLYKFEAAESVPTYNLGKSDKAEEAPKHQNIRTASFSYNYLYHDVKKTAALSLLIIAGQIILLVLFKSNVLKFLPISY